MARPTTTAKKTPPRPAPAKPPAKRGAPKARRKNTGSAVITLTVIVIAVLALTALPLCILVVAGLLPTGAAVLVDRHRRRYLARTVGAMNLAGVFPGALRMWEAGITFASLQQVIGSPYSWLVMYGAAAVGWMLYFCVPPVVAMVLEVKVDETRRRLEGRIKLLTEEWGDEVTGRR
ncbi:MAG: hypothetical protein ACLQJR_00745 [Stellaceae bacterium]